MHQHDVRMDQHAVDDLLGDQWGVIARRQIEQLGGVKADVDRMIRRRELVRLLPGVYLDHTGTPSWVQRAWAGVLSCWPAALSHESAVRAAAGPGWRRHRDDGPIHLAIPAGRKRLPPAGYVVHRMRDLPGRVQVNPGPPRVRLEEAVLDLAADAPTEFEVVGILADICQSRRTTAQRLLDRLAARKRLTGRDWIASVLADVGGGTCSVLEYRYLSAVERPHGLPRAQRQRADPGVATRCYRDVEYEDYALVVELDGRLFHDSAGQRDRDFDRDLDAAADGRDSVRLSWGQVVDRPCRTAQRVGALLQRRGWGGTVLRCGPGCEVDASSWSSRRA